MTNDKGWPRLSNEEMVSVIAVQKLINEIDCRIEHGASESGHMKYIKDKLTEIIRPEESKALWEIIHNQTSTILNESECKVISGYAFKWFKENLPSTDGYHFDVCRYKSITNELLEKEMEKCK